MLWRNLHATFLIRLFIQYKTSLVIWSNITSVSVTVWCGMTNSVNEVGAAIVSIYSPGKVEEYFWWFVVTALVESVLSPRNLINVMLEVTNTHTDTQTHRHTYICTHVHPYIHTYIHTHIHA